MTYIPEDPIHKQELEDLINEMILELKMVNFLLQKILGTEFTRDEIM